jgi:hypothetical protein
VDDRGVERSADLPPVGSSTNSKPQRRRSFFSRPFRRSRSTPAEEFVLMTTDGAVDRKLEKAESETAKRFRSPRRRNSGKNAGPGGQLSTLSSRSSSWASLKRSQTADNLTSVKNQLAASTRNGDAITGTNDIAVVSVSILHTIVSFLCSSFCAMVFRVSPSTLPPMYFLVRHRYDAVYFNGIRLKRVKSRCQERIYTK